MGVCSSRKKIPDEIYRFWAAVASAVRLGWLGTDDVRTEMKMCQLALSPNLLNSSAVEEDYLGLEEHLREGADICCGDERLRTPLHVAAAEGYEGTTRFLLQQGADVNAIDCDGITPLQDAIRSKCLKVVELLISAGACLEKSSVELGAEMCYIASLGDTEQMEVWKKAGVSFNFSDALGRTPLHVAVSTDQPEMVKFCISNGSDLEQRDRFNNRPIDDAQRLGLQHLVELLSPLKPVSSTQPEKSEEQQQSVDVSELSV